MTQTLPTSSIYLLPEQGPCLSPALVTTRLFAGLLPSCLWGCIRGTSSSPRIPVNHRRIQAQLCISLILQGPGWGVHRVQQGMWGCSQGIQYLSEQPLQSSLPPYYVSSGPQPGPSPISSSALHHSRSKSSCPSFINLPDPLSPSPIPPISVSITHTVCGYHFSAI